MAKGLKFKDTVAMPGSALYVCLKDGDAKKAEATYKATQEMHRRHISKEADEAMLQIRLGLYEEHQLLNEQRKARDGC